MPVLPSCFLLAGVALVAVRLFGHGLTAALALPIGLILILLGVGRMVGEAAKSRGLAETKSPNLKSEIMREFKQTIQVKIMTWDEIGPERQRLLQRALDARRRSQSPYSHYQVGAAVLAASGNVYAGCNAERVTYTQTTHAEQSAIDAMILGEPDRPARIQAVAIAAAPADFEFSIGQAPVAPPAGNLEHIGLSCGQCLQIIWENCGDDPAVELMAIGRDGFVYVTTIGDAFPLRFHVSEVPRTVV